MKCRIFKFNIKNIDSMSYAIDKFLNDENTIDIVQIYQVALHDLIITTIFFIPQIKTSIPSGSSKGKI